MSRKYTDDELRVIGSNGKFSPDDVEALRKGLASFKLMSQADKKLQKHRTQQMMPYPRHEVNQILMQFQDKLRLINNQLAVLTRALMDSRQMTEPYLAQTQHIMHIESLGDPCPNCPDGPCSALPESARFAWELYGDLPYVLRERVVGCGRHG